MPHAHPIDRPPPAAGDARAPRSSRGRVPRFILVMALLMGGFYAFYYAPASPESFNGRFIRGYLSLYAQAAGGVLRTAGFQAAVTGQSISGDFSVTIIKGCDAMEPKALFIAAVLAFPAPWRRKLAGMIAGLLALIAINLFRIVSLYWIGAKAPAWFDLAHLEVWQSILVLVSVALWVLWALWATRRPKAVHAAN
ncbi:Transmembrane exosortase [Phycisphaerae bacterium RAS1]|nr:Transmembrane exosortase [Phycisphaerae bacterium RAS1]